METKKVKEIIFGYMDITSMPIYVLEDDSKMIPIERGGHVEYVTEQEYLQIKENKKKGIRII